MQDISLQRNLNVDMALDFDIDDLPNVPSLDSISLKIDTFDISAALDLDGFGASLTIPGLGAGLVVQDASLDLLGGVQLSLGPAGLAGLNLLEDAIADSLTQLNPQPILDLIDFSGITSVDLSMPIIATGSLGNLLDLQDWGRFIFSVVEENFFDATLPEFALDVVFGPELKTLVLDIIEGMEGIGTAISALNVLNTEIHLSVDHSTIHSKHLKAPIGEHFLVSRTMCVTILTRLPRLR